MPISDALNKTHLILATVVTAFTIVSSTIGGYYFMEKNIISKAKKEIIGEIRTEITTNRNAILGLIEDDLIRTKFERWMLEEANQPIPDSLSDKITSLTDLKKDLEND